MEAPFRAMFVAPTAVAQGYPMRPIRLLVVTSGGLMDVAARLTAEHVGKALGQSIVIENPSAAPEILSRRSRKPRRTVTRLGSFSSATSRSIRTYTRR